jgi:hypothetical protein
MYVRWCELMQKYRRQCIKFDYDKAEKTWAELEKMKAAFLAMNKTDAH